MIHMGEGKYDIHARIKAFIAWIWKKFGTRICEGYFLVIAKPRICMALVSVPSINPDSFLLAGRKFPHQSPFFLYFQPHLTPFFSPCLVLEESLIWKHVSLNPCGNWLVEQEAEWGFILRVSFAFRINQDERFAEKVAHWRQRGCWAAVGWQISR